jgi:hypothetical protein
MTSFRSFARCLSVAAGLMTGAAIAQPDPPSRVGSVSAMAGSVVLASAGETAWNPVALNRPVTAGDRLWTDTGGRAEVHLGAQLLHVDSESFVDVKLLDDGVLQALLHEGVVQARVRALGPGELFEIDTPQVAVRAGQAGSLRIDADPLRHITRVAVREGAVTVSGASGRRLTLYPGQQIEIAGSDLEQVASVSFAEDDFDAWAGQRDAREEHSLAWRFLPPGVVGASQLDTFGTWMQDAAYGTVWVPERVAADWAPYRYGRWQWIRPWGWTWIDDAPWGFAPFHYGRWAQIGSRWAWVPGRLGGRPVYAPALVAFVGGGAGGAMPLGAGEGVEWYPLAPGESWRPFFAASATFTRRANEPVGSLAARPMHGGAGVTAMRIEEFRSGQAVQRHWQRPQAADLARAQPLAPLPGAGPRTAPQAQAPATPSRWQTPR